VGLLRLLFLPVRLFGPVRLIAAAGLYYLYRRGTGPAGPALDPAHGTTAPRRDAGAAGDVAARQTPAD
jgi:hypothetical protein